MRLLNAKTQSLEEYYGDMIPAYAILSHMWDKDNNSEVGLRDIQAASAPPTHKKGYQKILQTCRQALRDSLEYVWVDTCCIDKSSSAELSEAINSMFHYYQKAARCYAYLSDVEFGVAGSSRRVEVGNQVAESRWFTRGWTLQELLAPAELHFYSSNWTLIGSREDFSDHIELATGIDPRFLNFSEPKGRIPVHQASIAERMSWVSRRETSRSEDIAYCMLGVLGINMPLLYGEGGENAFIRLQEELVKRFDDQTIFAWGASWPGEYNTMASGWSVTSPIQIRAPDGQPRTTLYKGALAASPRDFERCAHLIPRGAGSSGTPFSITNKGLAITPQLLQLTTKTFYLLLMCGPKDEPATMLALPLEKIEGDLYTRTTLSPVPVEYDSWKRWRSRPIRLVVRGSLAHDRGFADRGIWIRRVPQDLFLREVTPPYSDSTSPRCSINRAAQAPSFVLYPRHGREDDFCIKIDFAASDVPRILHWIAGANDTFRAVITAESVDSVAGVSQESERSDERHHIRGLGSLMLSDGRLVYADLTRRTIHGNVFLLVNINTTRSPFLKRYVPLRHRCGDTINIAIRLVGSGRLGELFQRAGPKRVGDLCVLIVSGWTMLDMLFPDRPGFFQRAILLTLSSLSIPLTDDNYKNKCFSIFLYVTVYLAYCYWESSLLMPRRIYAACLAGVICIAILPAAVGTAFFFLLGQYTIGFWVWLRTRVPGIEFLDGR